MSSVALCDYPKATFNGFTKRLRPKTPDAVVPEYAAYYFRGPKFRQAVTSMSSLSTRASLNNEMLARLTIDLPPFVEQQAIGATLKALDDKIELNRRMNRTVEGMARAIFKSWFVDFDPVRAKAAGQPPPGLTPALANLFPDRFEDSELGEIPKGWRVTALEHVLDEIETGGRPKGGVADYKSGVPSIGAESIVELGQFDFTKTKYVPEEFYASLKKGRVKSRDVLLYKDGGRPGEFEPHVTMFGDGFPFDICSINEHVYRLRAKESFGQSLLYFWLSSALIMDEMRVKGTGVAIPGLNSTQARSLTTLEPTRQIAEAFDRTVEPLIGQVLTACRESRTLAALRDALLPKLISGELCVPDAERIVEATR